MKKINLTKLNLFTNAIMASGHEKQIDDLYSMLRVFRDLDNKIQDPNYTPTFKEIEKGGIREMYRSIVKALGKKLLWINVVGRNVTASKTGFISWEVPSVRTGDDGKKEYAVSDLLELCKTFMYTIDMDEGFIDPEYSY